MKTTIETVYFNRKGFETPEHNEATCYSKTVRHYRKGIEIYKPLFFERKDDGKLHSVSRDTFYRNQLLEMANAIK
jgi:hypothetical protein